MQPREMLARMRGVIPTSTFLLGMLWATFYGLIKFRRVKRTVTFYGSARLKDEYYLKLAYTLAFKLAKLGLPSMTGGGPALMEAANRGSYDATQESYGCNIQVPWEQEKNKFMSIAYQTDFFFVRKFLLRHSSIAFIAFPGGFGTMDEIFETLTLIRTKSIDPFPVILFGSSYWGGLIDYLRNTQVQAGTLSEADLDQIIITDDINEAVEIIIQHTQ
ncbi:TIGR00730 family Rossman fold protein [Gammaproteobacteria bacterium]|nr:TIGR00730 family Rossman fold protein [Gammaproteobacteria bacterium]